MHFLGAPFHWAPSVVGFLGVGSRYLRALVGLLDGAEDFPTLQSWVKAKGGVKGLNAQVARGLAYQIAGWSIGSFQRTSSHGSSP
jgi:hypothetical protein